MMKDSERKRDTAAKNEAVEIMGKMKSESIFTVLYKLVYYFFAIILLVIKFIYSVARNAYKNYKKDDEVKGKDKDYF